MATKKKLCSELKLGDKIVLPRETVKIIGEASLPYTIVSDDSKGKIMSYEIEYTGGPMKGQKGTVIVLSEAKVDYVLKDPLGKRVWDYTKGKAKELFSPPKPKKLSLRSK